MIEEYFSTKREKISGFSYKWDMIYESLNLTHQGLINAALRKLNYSLSEYSFANLYLFRNIHRYEVSIDVPLFVKGVTRKSESFLMPLFPISELSSENLLSYMNSEFLFPIPEEVLIFFNPKQFHISFLEEENDYLFHLEKLRYYPGRHLSKKRNLVKQFLQNYHAESSLIDNNTLEASLEVLDNWQKESDLFPDLTDYFSCKEALQLMERLDLTGRIYMVDGKPRGFLLGDYINNNTFIIRFAKADKSYKGIYQFIYEDFARSLPATVEWVNMEVDLGMESLHQAKMSYLPDRLIHKYRVSSKNYD